MKFEKLSLEKFASSSISNANNIYGGKVAATHTTPSVPDGGCSCSTSGGTHAAGFTYTSDTAVYNSTGANTTTEYHGSN